MKKILSIILCVVLAFCVSGCGEEKEVQINTRYIYTGVTFYRAEGLTLEELSPYNPALNGKYVGEPIKTIDDLEKYICQNLDTYTVCTQENGMTVIHHYNVLFESITVGEEKITLSTGENQASFDYTKNGNKYTVSIEGDELVFDCSYSWITYQRPITERFKIIYDYHISVK